MKHDVGKSVYKDMQKLPSYAQVAAATELAKIDDVDNFEKLSEVADIRHMESTDEPYFRLKFGFYRFLLYYDVENEAIKILSLRHRKDAYKRQNLPWLR